MSKIGYINVSLETFGGLLSLVFIVCLLITRKSKEKLERLYIYILTCNAVLLFCDAAAWLFKGKTDILSFYMVRISNFLVFILGYLMVILFTYYLVSYLKTKDKYVTKMLLYIMIFLMSLAVCLVVLSQFNHMYYVIDEQNIYHRQSWFWLSQAFGIAGMFLNGGTLFYHRNKMNRMEKWAFGSYIFLPVAAMLFQILFYNIAVLYLATTICLICIYISIQTVISQDAAKKELELEMARTSVMLSQIQPHFLYNALVGIKELCDNGEQQTTSKALEHFAYYLRGNLDSLSDIRLIPFIREVTHVKDYLFLEKIRFEEKLNIVWDLTFVDFQLPPLTLQPIVENAVRHGITEKKGRGTITIHSEEKGGCISIIVTDNGVGFNTEKPKEDGQLHIGIENVRSRLKMLCGGLLEIESKQGEGTIAKIILPETEVYVYENYSSGR